MAAALYPTASSLDDTESQPQVTVRQIHQLLERLCDAEQQVAPPSSETSTQGPVWRYLLAKPQYNDATGTKQGKDRARLSTLEGMVRWVVSRWDDQGLLHVQGNSDGRQLVIATTRLRLMLSDHAAHPLLTFLQSTMREEAGV